MIDSMPTVCVYCGARPGGNAAYTQAARAMGAAIARRGWGLVFGGGKAGLMGEVADAYLVDGKRAIGIIPESLMRLEVGHPGLHELHVVQTMHQRKEMMAMRADMFVTLPGGIGTLEEFFETWTWRHLGYHDKPIGLLNVSAYYDDLLAFLGRTVSEGFLSPAQQAVIHVESDPELLLDQLFSRRLTGQRPDLANS